MPLCLYACTSIYFLFVIAPFEEEDESESEAEEDKTGDEDTAITEEDEIPQEVDPMK